MAQELESYRFIHKIEKLPFVKKVILYGSREEEIIGRDQTLI